MRSRARPGAERLKFGPPGGPQMAPALNRFYTGDCLKVMDRWGGGLPI